MNNIRNLDAINEEELKHNIFGGVTKGSWHETYRDSAWVFLGGFSYELTEGDLICVMSQWGEIEDIHLIREEETGKSKGFAFIKYEDHRSTILAVDNFNAIKLLGRVMRCDHVENYKLPKHIREQQEEQLAQGGPLSIGPGHAYRDKQLASEHDIHKGVDLWSGAAGGEGEEVGGGGGKRRRDHKEHKHREHRDKKDHKEHKEHKERRHKERKQKKESEGSRSRSRSRSPSARRQLLPAAMPMGDGSAASWRGVRDPSMVTQAPRPRDPQQLPPQRRDELSGIGGMHRTR